MVLLVSFLFEGIIITLVSSSFVKWEPTNCGPPNGGNLTTQWTYLVDPNNPLPEYPRPQLLRYDNWQNLNGLWQFQGSKTPFTSQQISQNSQLNHLLDSQILVPFPPESCLSGIHDTFPYLQYKTIFTNFENINLSKYKILLQFGAIDWHSSIYINNKFVGNHTGGYSSFYFDITSYLNISNQSKNELFINVYDPTQTGPQPHGKQNSDKFNNASGYSYTPTSGIWQTVWIEYVQKTYIESVKIYPINLTSISINITIAGDLQQDNVTIDIYDPELNKLIVTKNGLTGALINISNIPNAHLWSPSDPFLYDLDITLNTSGDKIYSYFGLRTLSLDKNFVNQFGNKVARPLLNNKPFFMSGWLDQSYWPDGIYVAPTDEALESDIKAILKYGMNGARVHQKINPERWYYYADKLGVLIEQDMVQS